ncbi:hypothetical protein L218DRAFT_966280 [Marasmius fiardii PR-910]|nr:hypothetical protein L218DRAFT_966280 [Marasmius fiardii PR-910]
MSPTLQVEEVVYPPRDGYPLYLTAKRYWLPELVEEIDNLEDAWTLVFLHATSSHKESWEPTLQMIFQQALKHKKARKGVRIREAWCLDCPNHGSSAKLNERVLQQEEWYLNFTCEKYGRAVHHFLSAGPHHGAKVDFYKRKLCGIGHSLGGNAMCMLQSFSSPSFPDSRAFKSVIIVDPMLSADGPHHLKKLRVLLIKGAYERRDVWPDRVTAMSALKRRDRTKKWDPRILDVFIKYGVVPHQGSYFEESPYHGVTLACTRDQEAVSHSFTRQFTFFFFPTFAPCKAMYRDPDGATKPVEDLNKTCKEKPVHLILGGIYDFMPKRTHNALIDPKSGRKFASITVIPEAGHLVPLEVPDRLGQIVFESVVMSEGILSSGGGGSGTAVKSRL